jgi:hypothetical protein
MERTQRNAAYTEFLTAEVFGESDAVLTEEEGNTRPHHFEGSENSPTLLSSARTLPLREQ